MNVGGVGEKVSMSDSTALLYRLPVGVETRWASPENPLAQKGKGGKTNRGRKGRPSVSLAAGENLTLAQEAAGVAGVIRRIWLTISDRSPEMLRGLRIDAFWDGAATPAVSAPLGDFFGVGLGRVAAWESAYLSNPEGRSFNCVLPMPFRSGFRLTVTNETAADLPMLFYDVNYTVGDALPPDTLYMHTHWRRESPTTLGRDYEILPRVTGGGRFMGCNIGVRTDRAQWADTWWGEGEVKFYLDGDTDHPTLCGTETEDYIGTAWGQGAYHNRYQGCPVADSAAGAYCFYRWHDPDPIYFRTDIRVTIQQIGHAMGERQERLAQTGTPVYEAGLPDTPTDLSLTRPHGLLFERGDDWSSCAYFYLDRPANNLPALAPLAERIADL